MQYFRILSDNDNSADRWFLGEPTSISGEQIDARSFTYGQPYFGPAAAKVPIQYQGRRMQFNLAAFDMPVVSRDVAHRIVRIAADDVECFHVVVGDLSGYLILNAICRSACVDEPRSEILRWGPADGRPDKVGKYRMVSNLTIDPARTGNRHVFRVQDFAVALIVSGAIKDELDGLPNLGIVFKEVG